MSTTRWWNWKPRTYLHVAASSVWAFIVGAVAFHAMTDDWNRAWSYAGGFTSVFVIMESLRVRRRDGADADKVAEPEDWRPPLFGSGEDRR